MAQAVKVIPVEEQLVEAISTVEALREELKRQKQIEAMHNEGLNMGAQLAAFHKGLVDGGLDKGLANSVVKELVRKGFEVAL